MKRWLLPLLAGLGCWMQGGQAAEVVGHISIQGAIGPATAAYIERATKVAGARKAQCIIIQLDTPGGLLDSTKTIVQALYESPVPTVVYVAPPGANAGSAGCFITLAGHVAAMAPNTSIGAAHPVSLGGMGEQQKPDDVMKQKLENFATSYIESIAERRNRNVEWAKSAVRESASITAEKAQELKVIEIIAPDIPDLLRQLDSRNIDGRALKTAGATVVEIPRLAREKVFQVLWRPEVMFILMLVAIYGLIGELSNPGAIVPGVVGAIALVLVLYMSAILPINIAGVALIVLAAGLFVADVFAPTHGILTAGGLASFLIGSLMLFDRNDPVFRLSLALILPATVLTALFVLLVAGAGLRAQRLPVRAGKETMIGKTVKALVPITPEDGRIFVEGEYWRAVSDVPIEAGAMVDIVSISGLTLKVKPKG